MDEVKKRWFVMGAKAKTQVMKVVAVLVLFVLVAFWQATTRTTFRVYGSASKQSYRPLPVLQRREGLGTYLEESGFLTGIEIGVQTGYFSRYLLSQWPSCRRLYLIDVWKPQENYHDLANVNQSQQDAVFLETVHNLQPYANKTIFLRMFSNEAVHHILEQVDFIYVDARHDYCGCKEDIELYWPLIRSGGMMAGHDYRNATEVGQDWSVCMNGTINKGAVKGAVDEFAAANNLEVVTTDEKADWFISWMVRKP